MVMKLVFERLSIKCLVIKPLWRSWSIKTLGVHVFIGVWEKYKDGMSFFSDKLKSF